MRLRDITLAEVQQVRIWRNDPSVMPMLRTGYKSEAEQEAFYWQWCYFPWWKRLGWWLVNEPRIHRYYALDVDGQFVGIGGLTYIDGKEAEISLVLGPQFRGKGYGSQAVTAILAEAWTLGLQAVRGECYPRGAMAFWTKQVTTRPERFLKWHGFDGTLHWKWGRPQ